MTDISQHDIDVFEDARPTLVGLGYRILGSHADAQDVVQDCFLKWAEADRAAAYRATRRPPSMRDRVVILVDDGLATGSTMEAAIVALRQSKPSRIVVAAPVGARQTCARRGRAERRGGGLNGQAFGHGRSAA
jgi:hypothetical protein